MKNISRLNKLFITLSIALLLISCLKPTQKNLCYANLEVHFSKNEYDMPVDASNRHYVLICKLDDSIGSVKSYYLVVNKDTIGQNKGYDKGLYFQTPHNKSVFMLPTKFQTRSSESFFKLEYSYLINQEKHLVINLQNGSRKKIPVNNGVLFFYNSCAVRQNDWYNERG